MSGHHVRVWPADGPSSGNLGPNWKRFEQSSGELRQVLKEELSHLRAQVVSDLRQELERHAGGQLSLQPSSTTKVSELRTTTRDARSTRVTQIKLPLDPTQSTGSSNSGGKAVVNLEPKLHPWMGRPLRGYNHSAAPVPPRKTTVMPADLLVDQAEPMRRSSLPTKQLSSPRIEGTDNNVVDLTEDDSLSSKSHVHGKNPYMKSPDSSKNMNGSIKSAYASESSDMSWEITQKGLPLACARFSVSSWRSKRLMRIVSTQVFDGVVSTVLLLNAFWIGVQTEYLMREKESHVPISMKFVDWLFCLTFICELTLRLLASGLRQFFFGAAWAWNVTDFVLVTLQLIDEVMTIFYMGQPDEGGLGNLSFLRVVRVLRFLRVIRLVRVFRLIRELHTLVCSIAGAFRSFCWTLVLLSVTVYVLSIYFTMLVTEKAVRIERLAEEPSKELEHLLSYFGGVGRSVLTLYQAMSGGVDWDNVTRPLTDEFSPWAALLFVIFVAYSVLVLLNVVTGVFVEAASSATKHDNDVELVHKVREIFHSFHEDESDEISWDEFKSSLNNPKMQEYFKAIDLDLSEADGLFMLLDHDDSGKLDVHEFVLGCLRLTGPAKSLDMCMLLVEHSRATRWWGSAMNNIWSQLDGMQQQLQAMRCEAL